MSAVKKPVASIDAAAPKKYLEVKAAWLHQALVWPGGPLNAQTTLTDTKCPDMKLYLLPQGLLVTAKNKQTLVPYPNVCNCVLTDKIEV